MKRQKRSNQMGFCPGCGEQDVKIHPTHSPGLICYDCAERIRKADNYAAAVRGIRADMRAMGVPLWRKLAKPLKFGLVE